MLIRFYSVAFTSSGQISVLGDASTQYQGTCDGLTLQPEHILKVNPTDTDKSTAKERLQVESTVQRQTLKVADAISDLSRASGDISRYGNIPNSIAWMFVSQDIPLVDRQLPPATYPSQIGSTSERPRGPLCSFI